MLKEQPNLSRGDEWKNIDSVIPYKDRKSSNEEDAQNFRLYEGMLKEGKLIDEPKIDEKTGKIIGRVVREKNADGTPGKILYFKDKKMDDTIRAYEKKFEPPINPRPREN